MKDRLARAPAQDWDTIGHEDWRRLAGRWPKGKPLQLMVSTTHDAVEAKVITIEPGLEESLVNWLLARLAERHIRFDLPEGRIAVDATEHARLVLAAREVVNGIDGTGIVELDRASEVYSDVLPADKVPGAGPGESEKQ